MSLASRVLAAACTALLAPCVVVHASPPLTERAPSAVALVGATGSVLRDSRLPTSRLGGLPIGRLLEYGTRRLTEAGVPLADVDAVACFVLDAPSSPVAACAAGRFDRATLEAACVKRGAVPATVGVVPALRFPAPQEGDALYLSFLPGGEVLLASAGATFSFHHPKSFGSALQRLAERVPADASAWLVAERAWLDETLGAGVSSVAGDAMRLAAWTAGSPTVEIRVVVESPSDASAAVSARLWTSIAELVATTGAGNPGFAALAKARFRSEGARVLGDVSLTREELEALP